MIRRGWMGADFGGLSFRSHFPNVNFRDRSRREYFSVLGFFIVRVFLFVNWVFAEIGRVVPTTVGIFEFLKVSLTLRHAVIFTTLETPLCHHAHEG